MILRHSLLALSVVLASTTTLRAAGPPHAKFAAPAPDAVRWTDGFWADRFELCHKTVLPEMKKALLDPDNAAQLVNFRVAAGLEEGPHRGTNWGDGDCYKWIEAMAHVYEVTRDQSLLGEMDHWIELIAKSQAPDGYLSTQTQLNPEKDRWGQRSYHELYNMGHLMTAASVHYRATGKRDFLDVAVKLADYLDGLFRPRPKELAHFGWNPSNIMGLVDLYHATGERRYLELAGTFVDMRGSVPWPPAMWGNIRTDDPNPGDQNQDRVPLRKETQAVGHAVTAGYLYCGAADVFAETGDKALLAALERIWNDIVGTKMYVTGAVGAARHGLSPRGDKVHEAFGHAYDLPGRTGYNETCANIALAMFGRRMNAVSGEARYADVMERVLYNAGLSPMSLDGTRFCYCNPLARREGVPLEHHDTRDRWRTYRCYCCPPSVARTLAKVSGWAYGLSDDAVWINLYGSSELETTFPDGSTVRLVQETDYPWDGRVRISVRKAPDRPLALKLRIPGWCEGAEVRVNDEPLPGPFAPSSYAEVRRRWSSGDVIQIDLPMEPVLLEANPLVEQARGQAAVMRGPLVYCLESADLPPDVPLDAIRLPRNAEWKVEHDPALLGGVTTLETQADAIPTPSWHTLYRRVPAGNSHSVPIRLIPYYAWNNRGPGEMSVWIPVE